MKRTESIERSIVIFDLTQKMLINSESIFDTALFVDRELRRIAMEIRDLLHKQKIRGIKVSYTMDNENFIKLLQSLGEFLDKDPMLKDRMLHMRPPKTQ